MDGSRVYLNTRARLEVSEDAQERQAVLYEGEAFFEIALDVGRPFRVALVGSEIYVFGTRFNLYQKTSGEVVVTVLEGAVHVEGRKSRGHSAWRRELRANQQMTYGLSGVLRDVETTSIAASAVNWREGRLEIRDEPLANVLEELSRYTDRPIRIRDRRLKQLRVGGALSTRDVRAALARLEKLAPITVEDQGGVFVLRYRE